jgi:hypothetical protein
MNKDERTQREMKTMTQDIRERLKNVRIGEPIEAGGLQVFGLYWETKGPDYQTLDEAVAAGLFEVAEVSDSGSVPTLKVANKGKNPVFLMAGEHLAGGKQNRVLNASILVAAQSELPIPVSCVERGRWAYRAQFAGSGSSSHSHLRKMMHSQATSAYRMTGVPGSDQTEVWREVDRKLTESGSGSATQYLHKAYEDTEPMLQSVVEKLPVPEGASGAVFAFGGQIAGFDLFDRPGTLSRLWQKLVRAYAIDARVAPGTRQVSVAEVRAWLDGATAAKEEVFKSPGLGDDVRLESKDLVAACLRVEEQPVHVEAFAQEVAG